MLHLATHGEFRPSRLTDSYIEFWNDRLLLNQLRQLPLRFYQQLHNAPVKAMALRQAQIAMIWGNVRLQNNQVVRPQRPPSKLM
jgi:CHAT domain-containing protein